MSQGLPARVVEVLTIGVQGLNDGHGALLLAKWTPSDMVAWDIQEKREFREEAWARRRRATREPVAA